MIMTATTLIMTIMTITTGTVEVQAEAEAVVKTGIKDRATTSITGIRILTTTGTTTGRKAANGDSPGNWNKP
jgi:hypothetical protein